MWFFDRAINNAQWVIFRDMTRSFLKWRDWKDQQKELEKYRKKREKEEKKSKVEDAKKRIAKREQDNIEMEIHWWDIMRERFNESLYKHWRYSKTPVDRCEIKEWKVEMDWNIFPEKRLKVLDTWLLIIANDDAWTEYWLQFSGQVKKLNLSSSEVESYELFDNWILFYKKKWKNIFLKIDFVWNDKENLDLLLKCLPYIEQDEDTEMIYKIINYLESNNFKVNSEEIANLLNIEEEEAIRLINKLCEKANCSLQKNWKRPKTAWEVADEKLVRKHKIIKTIKKIILWIVITFFALLFLIILLASMA